MQNSTGVNMDKTFSFGENWLSYSKHIDEKRISEAVHSLNRLLPKGDYSKMSFLDIGCGSGLFSLAASRLNFKRIISIDIDPSSVQATQNLITQYGTGNWSCSQKNVFELSPQDFGTFDIVYSWGVLHHTGNMKLAIKKASEVVNENGHLVMALYRKTTLCPFWSWEKKMYNNGPKWFPVLAEKLFKLLFYIALVASKQQSPQNFKKDYFKNRGMHWHHDVIDWLGGYPYESISPADVQKLCENLNFSQIMAFTQNQKLGIFGSGCDEYCFKKN